MRAHHFKEKRPMIMVGVDKLLCTETQPRRYFDPAELANLCDSIRQNGILQPLTVRKTPNGYFLISGERRLRAAKMAGFKKVPCVVVNTGEAAAAIMALVENLQRQDLHFLEEAVAIERLLRVYHLTQEDAAARLGMASSTVSNKLRLLHLTPWQRERIVAANLSERHARALLKLPPDQRDDLLLRIIAKPMTVAQTEQVIDAMLDKETNAPQPQPCRKGAVADVRLFANTISKAVTAIQRLGADAKSEKTETDGYIQYRITIPKPIPEEKTEPLAEQLKLFV